MRTSCKKKKKNLCPALNSLMTRKWDGEKKDLWFIIQFGLHVYTQPSTQSSLIQPPTHGGCAIHSLTQATKALHCISRSHLAEWIQSAYWRLGTGRCAPPARSRLLLPLPSPGRSYATSCRPAFTFIEKSSPLISCRMEAKARALPDEICVRSWGGNLYLKANRHPFQSIHL